jgi:hypothetical protein
MCRRNMQFSGRSLHIAQRIDNQCSYYYWHRLVYDKKREAWKSRETAYNYAKSRLSSTRKGQYKTVTNNVENGANHKQWKN